MDEYENFARENAKDIIACGFNIDRTFVFNDYGYVGGDFYRNVTRISKRINRATADSCFGFTAATNIGKVESTSESLVLANRLLFRYTSLPFKRPLHSDLPSLKSLAPTRHRQARYLA